MYLIKTQKMNLYSSIMKMYNYFNLIYNILKLIYNINDTILYSIMHTCLKGVHF